MPIYMASSYCVDGLAVAQDVNNSNRFGEPVLSGPFTSVEEVIAFAVEKHGKRITAPDATWDEEPFGGQFMTYDSESWEEEFDPTTTGVYLHVWKALG
jgi:hypothetical protein